MGMTFLLIGGGNFLRQFATFLAQILVARAVGDSTFGLLSSGFSIMLLMVGLGDFGARLYFWRQLAHCDAQVRGEMASRLFWRHLIFSIIPLIPINIAISVFTRGSLAIYLHAYSAATVFNQVTFDWWFLGQERNRGLFLFNVSSAIVFLAGCVLLVHNEDGAVWFALLFSLSYAIPGLTLIAPYLHAPDWIDVRQSWRLPARTARYAAYDWMQRIYTAFLPLVAWVAFSSPDVAHFRIAYLFYALASTASVYLGSAIFNRMARTDDVDRRLQHLAEITGYLCLIVIPLSAVAKVAATEAVALLLPPSYGQSIPHLMILTPWLILPVVSNFLREATVGGGQPVRSMWSYAVTIFSTTAIIFFLPVHGTLVLSIGALFGEAAGILLLAIPIIRREWKSGLMRRLGVGVLTYYLVTAITGFSTRLALGWPHFETLIFELGAAVLTGGMFIAAFLKLEAQILTIPPR